MVKIAVAGGTGNVATELLRAPIRTGNHAITIFTRSPPPSTKTPGVYYRQVDYQDRDVLAQALQGFDTCLSFLTPHLDADNTVQKNLIHACITAGVRRFAPSEWALANKSGVPAYENKDTIAVYLAGLRERGELGDLQYCLFQPSVFTDYLAHPKPLSPGLFTWPSFLDFENRRAIILDDGDQDIVLTSVSDISEILALALEDDRPWPVIGSMQGAKTSINKLLTIGEKVRPGEWKIEHVKSEDVEKGELKTTWVPWMDHPVIPVEQREQFSVQFVLDFFRAMKRGAWNVGDEFNRRFPEFRFVGVEEYLSKAWEGRA